MRIIDTDKLTDYYDTANYGIDPSITFVRGNDTPLISSPPFTTKSLRRNIILKGDNVANNFNLQLFYIFFAGTVYPGLRIMHSRIAQQSDYASLFAREFVLSTSPHDLDNTTMFYYKHVDAVAAFLAAGYKLEHASWFGTVTNAHKLYDHFHNINTDWSKWLISNNIVVGYYMSDGSTRNNEMYEYNTACLKDWEFYKVKDSFTANQDIANYVGGVLPANANPMIELDDKNKILKAGFDLKTSFRKGKTKK